MRESEDRKTAPAVVVGVDGFGAIAIAPLIDEVFAIMRLHRLRLPYELVFLLKMVVMNEGMAAQLDPESQLGKVLAPYARRLVARQLSPDVLARRLG